MALSTSNIAALRDQAVTIIKSIVPDLESEIRFKELHYQDWIEDQPSTGSQSETTRGFQVTCGNQLRMTKWKATFKSVFPAQRLTVKVRYQIPKEDNGLLRLTNLSATDVTLLHQAFLTTTLWADRSIVRQMDLPTLVEDRPVPINEEDDLYLVTLNYRIQYAHA